MNSLQRNIAAHVFAAFAHDGASLTAAGAGDNVEAAGVEIDLLALPTRFESVSFGIAAKAVLAATKKLAVVAKIEHTDVSGTGYTDLVAAKTILTLTGGAGGSTERGAAEIGVSLEYSKRFIRVSVKPDLDATATDTAVIDAIAIFGGGARGPV